MNSTIELPRRVIGDHYNLQLFTRLLDAMGRPYAPCSIPAPPLELPAEDSRAARDVAKTLLHGMLKRLPAARAVLTRASSFSRSAEAALAR